MMYSASFGSHVVTHHDNPINESIIRLWLLTIISTPIIRLWLLTIISTPIIRLWLITYHNFYTHNNLVWQSTDRPLLLVPLFYALFYALFFSFFRVCTFAYLQSTRKQATIICGPATGWLLVIRLQQLQVL